MSRRLSTTIVASLILCLFLGGQSGFAQKKGTSKRKKTDQKTVLAKAEYAPSNPALPLKVSKNGRYFVNQYNQPFFFNADAGWLLLQKAPLADAIHYLKNRKSKLFNTVFVQLLPPEPDQKNVYGQSPFDEANDFLVRFSTLMRKTLEFSKSEYISIANEVLFLQNYLSIEISRFPNLFEFSIKADNNLLQEDVNIPALLIQPIVENSVKHAFKKVGNPGKLYIEIVPDSDLGTQLRDLRQPRFLSR